MCVKTLAVAAILSFVSLVSGAMTVVDASGKVLDAGGCELSALAAGKDANKHPFVAFDMKCPAEGKYSLAVKSLPPLTYFIHVDGFTAGRYKIDEYARGIEIELGAGVSKIRIDKDGGAPVSAAERKIWLGRLRWIKSSFDGTDQPCYFWAPEKAKTEAVPLVVGLHTWSCSYTQLSHYASVRKSAEERGWAFVGPNFRGPNSTPPACGGDPAVQDIIDAVNYAKTQVKIDPRRIYIIGGSGGGHMTLLMLGRHPEVFAAGSAFCPITDLARWHADSLLDHPGRGKSYAKMMEGACGGKPSEKASEYAYRSPLTWLKNAKAAGVPAYVCTGIHDGWTGSVPVGHSFRAFNALCDAGAAVSESDIAAIEATQQIPATLKSESKDDPFYGEKLKIHFRRTSDLVRLTIFEGGHAGNFAAGFDFLARQVKGQAPDWTIPSSGKGAAEGLSK